MCSYDFYQQFVIPLRMVVSEMVELIGTCCTRNLSGACGFWTIDFNTSKTHMPTTGTEKGPICCVHCGPATVPVSIGTPPPSTASSYDAIRFNRIPWLGFLSPSYYRLTLTSWWIWTWWWITQASYRHYVKTIPTPMLNVCLSRFIPHRPIQHIGSIH